MCHIWVGTSLLAAMTADTPTLRDQTSPNDDVSAGGAGAGGQRRVGLFGGTFDPPHLGHLVVADQVRVEAGLDEVWFVVANDPWQKADRDVTPARQRLALTQSAVGSTPGLVVSDIELDEGGPSYTIDTLETLRRQHPDVAWSIIVGGDAADGLDTWHRADDLAAVADVIVINRPGALGRPSVRWQWRAVEVPAIDISSTDLRSRVRDGRSVRFLLPDPVITLVERTGLYRPAQ